MTAVAYLARTTHLTPNISGTHHTPHTPSQLTELSKLVKMMVEQGMNGHSPHNASRGQNTSEGSRRRRVVKISRSGTAEELNGSATRIDGELKELSRVASL